MSHEILMSVENGLLRVAQIEDAQLTSLQAAPMGQTAGEGPSLIGQIYLGQVERVVPRLQAAFVDIGMERAGFLGAREARALLPGSDRETPIEDCVQDGDTVLVQITRPPHGDKGAQITADVTLPGRAVVLAPCRSRIAVSRQIEDEAERARLADLAGAIRDGKEGDGLDVEGMDGPAGWVIRTAAIGMQGADMAADMASVAAQWESLLAQAEDCEPPAVLYQDLGPIEKALRDLVRAQTTAVVMEDAQSLAQAKAFAGAHMPAALALLQASDKGEILFDRYDVAGQLAQALSNRVNLASGGWLMIETTEAMTTIDVNSGSDTADARGVNLAAAQAIGAQLRLRALGGLVAIDFIDMSDAADNEAVLAALEASFEGDKNPVRIGPMSEFGVVEMTRRRDVMSLAEAMRQRSQSRQSDSE